MINKKFGKLLVLYRTNDHIYPNGRHDIVYRCKCDCGKEIDVLAIHLRSGHTKSCGCYRAETSRESMLSHGLTNTRLYSIWKNMKARCFNKNRSDYYDYGARGITICTEWLDFENFYNWAINNGYNDSLTLDRANYNGNYEPCNCRWVSQKKQCNNTRNNILICLQGSIHTLSEWCEILNKNYGTVHSRIQRGWDVIKALTT